MEAFCCLYTTNLLITSILKQQAWLGRMSGLTCPPGPPGQRELDLLVDADTAVVRTPSYRRGEARLGRQRQAGVAEP